MIDVDMELFKDFVGQITDIDADTNTITLKIELSPRVLREILTRVLNELNEELSCKHIFEPHFGDDICIRCGRYRREIDELERQRFVIEQLLRDLMGR